tara:strand:+ start:641 stop:1084 length:444 start_codon:yes stop_codon:yes gene_type:complete
MKHLAHSSAAVVLEKSSHAPAKSNSYVGLAMLALSGSLLPTGLPEMGSRVRPLLLTAPDLGALKKRLPVRELSVASMMAVKRPMTMGSEKKTSRSAAASGPLKHVSSTHLRARRNGDGVDARGVAQAWRVHSSARRGTPAARSSCSA